MNNKPHEKGKEKGDNKKVLCLTHLAFSPISPKPLFDTDLYIDEDEDTGRYLFKGFSKDDVLSTIELLKSEPTSLCLKCHERWDGLVNVCKSCGSRQIEHYIDYDDIDECFQLKRK